MSKRGQHPPAVTGNRSGRSCRRNAGETSATPRRSLQARVDFAEARLLATIHELARANLALQTSNEELLALNDELAYSNQRLELSEAEVGSLNRQLSEAKAGLSVTKDDLELLQGVALPTLFLDDELRIRRFTAAATEVFYFGDQDIGCSIRDFEARFSNGELAPCAKEVLERLQPREVELFARGRQFLVRLRPHRATTNVIVGVVVTFVDISELKRAETQVALSRLYAVLSRVNEAIVRTRAERPLFEEVCRIVAEEGGFPLVWIGLVSQAEVLPVAWSEPASKYLSQVEFRVEGELGSGPTGTSIRENRTVVNEDFQTNPVSAAWRRRAADFGFRASASLPLRRQGRVVGALSLYATRPGIFDQAHVKLLESLSADLSYALDAMQQEQARAEAERALRESDARLRDAERNKDEFLAMLSHELRNPLAPIQSSLFILDHATPGTEQVSRARAVLGRQVQQLTRLVDDLLDVTRISKGKLRVVPRRFDLVELIRSTAEDHRAIFTEGGLELELRTGSSALWVEGDKARLAQVVGNLLTNAAKFTASGGQVLLELEPEPCGGMAVLRVRDTGIGMSREMLLRLFQPFAQADDTLDRSRGGLGLGLALVKAVVELHGGRVEGLSGGLGAGAEFVVRLPVGAAPPPEERPRQSTRPPPRRVLVIEDNEDAAETLRDFLELAEHQVQIAGSGPEGLKKAQGFRPEVVLCDIGLPGMDGYEVARALRRDADLRTAHLVALTGYALPDDEGRAREAGFDEHLAKPASAERIEELLANVP